MSRTLRSSVEEAVQVSEQMLLRLEEYCSLSLSHATSYSDGVPPQDHDRSAQDATVALEAMQDATYRDARAFERIGVTFEQTDRCIAFQISESLMGQLGQLGNYVS